MKLGRLKCGILSSHYVSQGILSKKKQQKGFIEILSPSANRRPIAFGSLMVRHESFAIGGVYQKRVVAYTKWAKSVSGQQTSISTITIFELERGVLLIERRDGVKLAKILLAKVISKSFKCNSKQVN